MCNLSQGIAERAAEEAAERVIQNMRENKFTLEQIALATGKTIKEIEAIRRKR